VTAVEPMSRLGIGIVALTMHRPSHPHRRPQQGVGGGSGWVLVGLHRLGRRDADLGSNHRHLRHTLTGHIDAVLALGGPDGSWLASANWDGELSCNGTALTSLRVASAFP
jgi:hypothetical protein